MVRFGVISDPHLAPVGTRPAAHHNPYALARAEELLQAAVAHCAAARVDAVFFLGDLSHRGDADSTARALEIVAGAGCPVWVVAGNHDLIGGVELLAALAGKSITVAPWATSRQAWGLLTGVTILPNPAGVGIWAEFNEREGTVPGGLALVLSHYPLVSLRERLLAAGLADAGDLVNVTDTTRALAYQRQPMLILHGHLHVRAAMTAGAVLQLGCAALIEPPHEVAIVELGGEPEAPVVRRRCASVAPFAVARLPVLTAADERWIFENGWRQLR